MSDGHGSIWEFTGEDRTAQAEAERKLLDAEIEADAHDLARNDCQIWDNLPQSAKDHYRKQAVSAES